MTCAIDWQLVLDFAKVLAAPLAAIAIAILGLSSYRGQKRVDRRIEWYQQLHSLLVRTADLHRWAGAAHAAGDAERSGYWMAKAIAASQSLSERIGEGFVFGLEADLVALRRLVVQLEECHGAMKSQGHVSDETGNQAAGACAVAANVVAAGFRRELGLPAIDADRIEKQITG